MRRLRRGHSVDAEEVMSVDGFAEIRRLHRLEAMPIEDGPSYGRGRNTVRRALAADAPANISEHVAAR